MFKLELQQRDVGLYPSQEWCLETDIVFIVDKSVNNYDKRPYKVYRVCPPFYTWKEQFQCEDLFELRCILEAHNLIPREVADAAS